MKLQKSLLSFTQKIEKLFLVRAVRNGLITIIPILMIGSFALIGRTFPIPAYITFINTFAGGLIYNFFNMIYTGTFGFLSIFMTLAIASCYSREKKNLNSMGMGAPITALICFFILSGAFTADFSNEALGVKGMLTAIFSGFLSSALYCFFEKFLNKTARVYTDGADVKFNAAISVIFPAAAAIILISSFNTAIDMIFNVGSFYQLIISLVNKLFLGLGRNFGSGLLYVAFSSLLWFFGIHGSDCLEGVSDALFSPAIQININALAAGGHATEILTKQFFDIFVLMGGCGSAICLLISLFIFGKRRSDKKLFKISAFPMIFNINETMIFGLPVILNPVMFIPFLLAPITSYIISYLSIQLGIVGMTISAVEWTTPVLFGGYAAVGSVGGSLLQLFNIIIGVLIYAPFVRMLDQQKIISAKAQYAHLVDILKEHELSRKEIILTEMENTYGEIAKAMALDLKVAINNNMLKLFYQPQYSFDGKCIGVEGLLRWEHSLFHSIYPPLVIELAKEANLLPLLEKHILTAAISDMQEIKSRLGDDVKISINLTGDTMLTDWFIPFLKDTVKSDGHNLCLEITEQTALKFDDKMFETFSEIKNMGILLAIDDFSMGQTSINYLKEKNFDVVKLDGVLVNGILTNKRCREIISSIVSLSRTLGISVLAEYVETEEQRDVLNQVGCTLYQGYLYSPAVPVSELKNS